MNKCDPKAVRLDKHGGNVYSGGEPHEWQCYGVVDESLTVGSEKYNVKHFKVCPNCDTVVEIKEKHENHKDNQKTG